MNSAALSGRPKAIQKWTFNELDSESVVIHFQRRPFESPKPIEANFQRSPGRERNTLHTGILSVRSIGVFASRSHVINAGCKRLSSGYHGVQWLAVIVTAWPHKLELHQPTSTSAGNCS